MENKSTNKILVIGTKGRIEKYTSDPNKYKQYEIKYVSPNASDEEILEVGKDADLILVDAMGRVSRNVIDQMPNLKMIHSEGVGYQGVDVKAATEKEIYVCNCKSMNASAVAEQTILLMLGLLKNVVIGNESVRKGTQIQTKESYMLSGNLKELSECTVGLIGFGDIAKATAKLLHAFGAKVIYYKRTPESEDINQQYHVEYVPLDQLLKESDIVSLHLPVTEKTRYMVNKEFFQKMKLESYLINTSRGELVDNHDLIDALENDMLAGAGLDTIDGEPIQKENPLCNVSDKVNQKLLLSCHIGGITGASFRRGYEMVWADFEKVSKGEKPDHCVNL